MQFILKGHKIMYEIIVIWKDNEKNIFTDIEHRNNEYEAFGFMRFELKCENTISVYCKQLNFFETGTFVK